MIEELKPKEQKGYVRRKMVNNTTKFESDEGMFCFIYILATGPLEALWVPFLGRGGLYEWSLFIFIVLSPKIPKNLSFIIEKTISNNCVIMRKYKYIKQNMI